MATEFSEITRVITHILSSLRHSVDRPLSTRFMRTASDRERHASIILIFEEMRIRFGTFTRFPSAMTPREWKRAKENLLDSLESIIHSESIPPDVFDRKFRPSIVSPRANNELNPIIHNFFSSDDMSVGDALVTLRDLVDQTVVSNDTRQTNMTFEDLEKIIPPQQVAPVQFEIKDNRLKVLNRPPEIDPDDSTNVSSALEHILDSGKKLIEGLENSNCDPRLVDTVKHLQCQLADNENVIKIGMSNISCGLLCAQYSCELPDALNGMLVGYSSSVSMYVAQFPEWHRFSEKAASLEINETDINDLESTARDISDYLKSHPSISHPDVPRTIDFIKSFLDNPGQSSRKAAFAVLRTVENLVSVILRYSIEYVDRTAKGVVENGSKLTSKVIVGLVAAALIGASGVATVAVKTGTPWVEQAAEIVQRFLEKSS